MSFLTCSNVCINVISQDQCVCVAGGPCWWITGVELFDPVLQELGLCLDWCCTDSLQFIVQQGWHFSSTTDSRFFISPKYIMPSWEIRQVLASTSPELNWGHLIFFFPAHLVLYIIAAVQDEGRMANIFHLHCVYPSLSFERRKKIFNKKWGRLMLLVRDCSFPLLHSPHSIWGEKRGGAGIKRSSHRTQRTNYSCCFFFFWCNCKVDPRT